MDGTLGCKELPACPGWGGAWGQADSGCLGSELTCPSAGGFGVSGPFLACDGPPVLSDSVPAWSIAVLHLSPVIVPDRPAVLLGSAPYTPSPACFVLFCPRNPWPS